MWLKFKVNFLQVLSGSVSNRIGCPEGLNMSILGGIKKTSRHALGATA